MAFKNNDEAVFLLKHDHDEFILHCQEMIKFAVAYFISKGMLPRNEREDIIQDINEQLYLKIPNIERLYGNSAMLKTYTQKIINNICYAIHRKNNRKVETTPINEFSEEMMYEDQPEIYFQNEIERLEAILQIYHQKNPKVIFLVKMYLGLSVTIKEISNCFPNISRYDKRTLLKFCNITTDHISSEEVFEKLCKFLNKYEKKNNKADSARRWAKEKVDTLIQQLNGIHNQHSYSEETLKTLFEMHSNFLNNNKR